MRIRLRDVSRHLQLWKTMWISTEERKMAVWACDVL